MPLVDETIRYLEMTDPSHLSPKRVEIEGLEIVQAENPSPEFNRFLYTAVGGDWHWLDLIDLTYRQWMERISQPGFETWVAYVKGTPSGYFELEKQPGDNVEIAYFGLLGSFIGQGLGGHLLTACVERAWDMGASRVWLHTCSFDHPYALANYEARGFTQYKVETKKTQIPDEPTGPWPGAGPR